MEQQGRTRVAKNRQLEAQVAALQQELAKHQQVEAELRQNEERLRLVIDTAQIGYWEWDLLTDSVTWDEQHEKLFGLAPGSFGGTYTAFLDLLHPEDCENVRQAVQHTFAEDVDYSSEFRVIWPSGEICWIAGKGRLFRDSTGQPVRIIGMARDITERKRAEETMARYQLLSENARDIVLFIRAGDGRIIEANQAAVSAYGYDRPTLLTKTIYDLRDPATRDVVPEEMEQADTAGILFETRHCRSDGSTFPVEVSSRGATAGEERLLLSIIRDITERKQAEESLRHSQERLQAVLRAGRMGWWERDLRTHAVIWSDSFFDLLGQMPRNSRASYDFFLQRVHPNDRQKVEDSARRAMDNRGEYSQEFRLLHPNGGVRWVLEKGRIFYDSANQPQRIVGVSIDITQRKWIEEALRESEATLRSFYDNAPLLMGIIEISEDNILHIYDNPAVHRFLGLSSGESTAGRWTSQLGIPPPAIREFLRHLRASEASGQPVHFEYIHNHPTDPRWLAVTVSAIGPGPSSRTRFCYVAEDVTERKQAEEALRQSEQRQRLLAELGEAMRHLEDPDELLSLVVQAVGEHLQVARCLFIEIDLANDWAVIQHEHCRGVPSVAGEYPVSDYSSVTRADMEAGRTVINRDSQSDPRTADLYKKTYQRYGERAYIAVPLLREGRWVSALWVSTDTPRDWTTEEITLLETVAERAWLAVENARLNMATRAAVEQLRQSEWRFRELADSLPQLVWTSNSEGVLDYYNNRVGEYSGGTRAPDGSWQWELLLHPDDLGPTLAAWQAAAENEQPYWFEHRMRMADGSYRWHLSRAVPMRDGTGAVKWFGTATDIHDLRRAQETQHELAERLQLALDAGRMNAFEWHPASDQVRRTGNAPQVLGVGTEDTGQNYFQIIHPEDRPEFLALLQELSPENPNYQVEYRVIRPDTGLTVWLHEWAQATFDDSSHLARLTGLVMDITERKRVEADQHVLAEIRERNRLAQELHDTVAQTLGYLNLKISLTHSLLADNQLEAAKTNLQDLKQVVNETYTDVREEIFNLRAKALSGLSFMEMLSRYVDKYRRFYNLDIHLVQEIDPALFEFPDEVSSQIIRTIQEALINIRKHAQVNTATIRLGQENGQSRVIIEDQGQGFDLAIIKEKTSSFGLQIMRERVESVGGSLEVATAPGQGTRITLHYLNQIPDHP